MRRTITINPETIVPIMRKAELGEHQPSSNDVHNIIGAMMLGKISVTEKNELLAHIIRNQLLRDGKYMDGIRSKKLGNSCTMCNGKGFNTIVEVVSVTEECRGNEKQNALPCGGSGLKNSVCNKCNGLTLNKILEIRMDKLNGKIHDPNCNFDKIQLNKTTIEIAKTYGDKTFRIFSAKKNGDTYYYIPPKPCSACGGSGVYVYDRKNFQCSKCNGKGKIDDHKCDQCEGGRINVNPIVCPGCNGNPKKRLISTNNVKSFNVCNMCNGLGTVLINPVISDNLPDNILDALQKSKFRFR